MGADPVCLLAALGLPEGFQQVAELAEGLGRFGVPLAGGDLSRAPVLTVAVTAVGRCRGRCCDRAAGPATCWW